MNRPPLASWAEGLITVSDLVSTPLWTVNPDERTADAVNLMNAWQFDIAGIASSPLTHYVTAAALAGSDGCSADVALPIPASSCVERTLPLGRLLDRLATSEFVFVLDQDQVRWIVTRADLQSPAVGFVVLAHLTSLENAMKRLVLLTVRGAWRDSLPPARRRQVDGLYQKKRRENAETGLEDCLYFSDWVQLCSDNADVRERLAYEKDQWDSELRSIVKLRNTLAHGGTILDDRSPTEAIHLFQAVRRLGERIWIEAATLDPIWERYGETVLVSGDGSNPAVHLAGPGTVRPGVDAGIMHVITAWNPGSSRQPDDVNRASNCALDEYLTRHGHPTTPCVGMSPDGRWKEESLLVKHMSRERASEVGAMFGQLAIFELDDESLIVVRCSDAAEVLKKERYS